MTTSVDLKQLAIDRGAAPPGGRFSRHVLSRYVLPAALALGFVTLLVWSAWEMVFPATDVTVVPVLTSTAESQPEGTPLFKAAGWIEPRPTPIRVAALAPGVVKQLLVVEDQRVTAGEPVAHLIDDDAKLQHDQTLAVQQLRRAEHQRAQAVLTAAETRLKQPVHLQAELGEAAAALAKTATLLTNLPFEVRRAETRHRLAKDDWDRKRQAQGVVSGLMLDRARSEHDTALAWVEELKSRADSLEKERSALRQRRDALRRKFELLADEIEAKDAAAAQFTASAARLRQADVAVAESKLRLDRMVVRAPVEGRVLALIAHPGARLAGRAALHANYDGSTVVTMYQPGKLQVRVDVRFKDLPRVHLKQKVKLDNPAILTSLSGEVLFVSSVADIQKNTLEVKVAIDDPPPVFKPQMLVDVTFLARKPPAGRPRMTEQLRLFIPAALILGDDSGPMVWVADQSEGVARRTTITLGMTRPDGMVEVTSGLNEASRIIVSGAESLRDGQRIRITSEAAPTLRNRATTRPAPAAKE